MNKTNPSLGEMSGETQFQKAPQLLINEIRVDGKTGKFLYKDVLAGKKDDGKGKEVYDEKEIGDTVKLVFLKIRRKLIQFRKDQKPLATTEHNHKSNRVVLFGGEKPEKNTAEVLREKYQGLRTVQIVYALYKGELVRLMVKGASLGSKAKAKEVKSFYDYLGVYQGDELHFYEYETILTSIEEIGDLGSYYVMTFEQGEKLADIKDVETKMAEAYNFCKATDEHYASQDNATAPVNIKEELDVIDYDAEEGNSEEIPF